MGIAISCDRCPTAATSSVVNLSDPLVRRMVDGIEEPPARDLGISADEKDWIDKLKCLDDAHSSAYSLTYKGMEDLMKRVEARIKEGTMKKHCPDDVVKGCYKFNADCSLRCAKEVAEFIDCLDAKRLQRLKEIVEEANRKQQLAEAKARRAKQR